MKYIYIFFLLVSGYLKCEGRNHFSVYFHLLMQFPWYIFDSLLHCSPACEQMQWRMQHGKSWPSWSKSPTISTSDPLWMAVRTHISTSLTRRAVTRRKPLPSPLTPYPLSFFIYRIPYTDKWGLHSGSLSQYNTGPTFVQIMTQRVLFFTRFYLKGP